MCGNHCHSIEGKYLRIDRNLLQGNDDLGDAVSLRHTVLDF